MEAVPDTNRQELAVVTAYKNKATEQQTRDANSPHSDARNASADVAFNNNIPQSGNSVNSHYNVALAERLEEQSKVNEPLSVEDVKKATGFGEEGAKLVTELANSEGVTFSQAKSAVETAYAAGFANVESSKVSFETDTQIDAFTAGKKDRVMQNLAHRTDTNQDSVDRFYGGKESNVNSDTSKRNGNSNSDLKSNAENGIINKNNISGAVNNENVRETVERDGYISPEYETIETRKPIVATDFKADKQRRADTTEKYGLSPDEAIRLEGYVGGQMCYILNKRMIDGTLVNGDSEVVDSIRNALLKMPEYAGRTYRNLKFNTEKEYNDFLSKYSEGKMVELKSFTSASKLPNGYTKFGNGVVHLVIDGVSGRDIADTFGLPRQQEVIYLPGTTIEIKKVMIANDGNVLIFAQEVTPNENIRTKETGDFVNNRPETGIHRDIDGYGTESVGNGANNSGVQREVRSGNGRDGVLSEWGKSADGGNVLAGKGNTKTINTLNNEKENSPKKIKDDVSFKSKSEVTDDSNPDSDVDKFEGNENTDNLAMWTTKRVGDKVKPKSISEIVATIEHEFGINITTGHIRGNGVLGQYNKDNRGIRTKIANNLPVISHELGHYFERTLDIKSQLSNELIQELKSQLDAGFAANYTGEQIIREGVAEYVRRFLKTRGRFLRPVNYFLKNIINHYNKTSQAHLNTGGRFSRLLSIDFEKKN